jgi:hypothetical protein
VDTCGVARVPAPAGVVGEGLTRPTHKHPLLLLLPHAMQVYARRCTSCTKREEAPGQLKKCGQCGCAVYCSQAW